MFHPSSERLSFRQQVIGLNQSYPCPRCTPGIMDPFGLTETFQCNTCDRVFVPLKGGRFLYPARHLGWKIAPTFWWDGFRWHWAGTTATARQLTTIVAVSLLPVVLLNIALFFNLWSSRPDWCNAALLSPLVGLVTVQLVYLLCWDFDFLSKKRPDQASTATCRDVQGRE